MFFGLMASRLKGESFSYHWLTGCLFRARRPANKHRKKQENSYIQFHLRSKINCMQVCSKEPEDIKRRFMFLLDPLAPVASVTAQLEEQRLVARLRWHPTPSCILHSCCHSDQQKAGLHHMTILDLLLLPALRLDQKV